MSYTALYRKWRPSTFEDVKGQDHIVTTLKNQIRSKRMGHAYLFCGTRGTGKTSVAKIFARAVNCQNGIDGSPCNVCDICKGIIKGSSMNVVEIDAASNNGVENIREIRDQVQYPPTEGTFRVYIIDEVHMLSTGAFNALLKTLEEPPSYVIFILATTEVHKIPITVLSRCQRYDFKRITLDTLANRLNELAKEEGIDAQEKALQYIAKVADGSMRDALSLLDQCVAFHFEKTLTYDNVLEVLGAVDATVFSKLLRCMIAKDMMGCMKTLEEMVIQGRELGQFITDFIWYLRNVLLLKSANDAESMLEMSEDNIAQLKEETKMVEEEVLMRYIRIFSELSNQIKYSNQKRVLIEVAMVKMIKPQMEENYDSILQRLNELEMKVEEGVPIALETRTVIPEYREDQKQDQAIPPSQVVIPKAQLEDLNLIRKEWGKIIRSLGGAIRPAFRDTIIEPSGDSSLCIVFSSEDSFTIGNRPTALGELDAYVKEQYGKEMYFKTRMRHSSERLNTIYVSDEELKEAIHMEITIED